AFIFVGEVRGLDRLRRDLENRLGGSIGLAVVTIVFADDVDVDLEGLGLGALTVHGEGKRNLADLVAVWVAVPLEVDIVLTVSIVFADDVDVALEGLGLGAFTVDGDGERNLADLEAVGVAVPPEVEDVVTVSFGRLGLSGQGVLDAVALLDS